MLINHTGLPSNKSKPIEKCVICQCPLDRNVSNISGCSHQFHKDCIDNWKNITNKCPVCRKRFTFIQQGHHKYKVAQKDQKNDDGLTDEYLNTLDEEPCQICQSTDYAEYGLLCDGCDKCFHTHCLGLDDIPEGNWYCDTCKCLQSDYKSTHRNRNINRNNNRRRNRRNYDLNHHMISHNENNPEWLQTQDEDWTPPEHNDNDIDDVDVDDMSSENNEEFEELKQNELHNDDDDDDSMNGNNNINKRKTKRKRKRCVLDSESESDLDMEISNKRRKINNNNNNRESKNNNNNNKSWDCDKCTFMNEWDNEVCFMCETKKNSKIDVKNKNKLSINDYFSNSNNKNKNKNKNKNNKKNDIYKLNVNLKNNKKYSRSNPYRQKKNQIKNKKNSVNNIIGEDILSRFDLGDHESDDWFSVVDNDAEDKSINENNNLVNKSNENNQNMNENGHDENNNNDKHEMIEDYDDDDNFEFKPKPKVKYRDKLKKLTKFQFI